MKATILFASIIYCSVLQTNAQTSGNNTIVNDNAAWSILWYMVGPTPYFGANTEYIYLDGDSIIAGHLYKKVFSCNDSLHQNVIYRGLIREEDKKTYFIPADSETECLLYDFSLEEGMSFEYRDFRTQQLSTFYVNTVDSININGFAKKRMQFSEIPSHEGIIDTWIEGIGSLNGILYPFYNSFIDGNINDLLCYFKNNELVYKNPKYSKCYYDKAEDISVPAVTNKETHIYPNFINNRLISFSSGQTISRVEIFDISGKKVYTQLHGNSIDASSFAKGLYVVKVCDLSKQVSVFKIIKQ